jgi:hypothetical protein
MNKITLISAVASAYATVAATSFALGFLLAPAKAQAGESENILREAPPYSLSRHRQPDRVTDREDDQIQPMRLQALTGSAPGLWLGVSF